MEDRLSDERLFIITKFRQKLLNFLMIFGHLDVHSNDKFNFVKQQEFKVNFITKTIVKDLSSYKLSGFYNCAPVYTLRRTPTMTRFDTAV